MIRLQTNDKQCISTSTRWTTSRRGRWGGRGGRRRG